MAEFEFAALLQQAQALQEKLKAMQEEVAARTVDGQAGGGMVKAVADGAMRIHRVVLDPALFEANDKPMLEDLVVVAVNDALERARQMVAEEMGKLGPLGGLGIPGLG